MGAGYGYGPYEQRRCSNRRSAFFTRNRRRFCQPSGGRTCWCIWRAWFTRHQCCASGTCAYQSGIQVSAQDGCQPQLWHEHAADEQRV